FRNTLAQVEPHAFLKMPGVQAGRKTSRHRPAKRLYSRLDDTDGHAPAAQHCRKLHPDQPAPDDRNASTGLRAGKDRRGISKGSKLERPFGTGTGKTARASARGKKQPVIEKCPPVTEEEVATGGIDLRYRHAGKIVDAGSLECRGRADRFHLDGTVQGLGERRTLVGQMRFGADERDGPAEPRLTQGESCAGACFPGADDD